MQDQLIRKYSKLKELLRKYKKFVLAFSGGVDSQFILYTGKEIDDCEVFAVTVHSELHGEEEIENAISVCNKMRIPHKILNLSVLDHKKVKSNLPRRCYWCKQSIFNKILDYADHNNIKHILDGTNADDLEVYRPGRQALEELNIKSPLMEVGLTKTEIRSLAKAQGYYFYDLPSKPCLATRFPYHTELSKPLIIQVKKGEDLIKKILKVKNFRLRFHNNIARIEVPPEDFSCFLNKKLRNQLIEGLKQIGFLYVTLDLEGFRSGSMDIDIELLSTQKE